MCSGWESHSLTLLGARLKAAATVKAEAREGLGLSSLVLGAECLITATCQWPLVVLPSHHSKPLGEGLLPRRRASPNHTLLGDCGYIWLSANLLV